MSRRRIVSLISAGLIIGGSLFTAAAPVAAHGPSHHRSQVKVLLDGLSSPKGIHMGAGKRSVVVSQGAFGPPAGPILEYFLKGPQRGTAQPLTDPLNLVDITRTRDGAGWGIGGDLVLYRQAPDGTIAPVLDIQAYQTADPDPVNSPTEPADESNPYGLAALPSNDVLLVDAAGNDVIRVSPDGSAHTVARWSRQRAGGESVEAVPTSIAIGRDGWAYVGQLVGGPGTPGKAHIWRLNPNAENAVCRVGKYHGACRDWKRGFTGIVDLAWDTHNKTLYVYQIARGGYVAFEAGFAPGGVFPKAVLLQVKNGKRSEIAKGKLSQPGGIAVGRDGAVFVTDGMFTGGRLLQVRKGYH